MITKGMHILVKCRECGRDLIFKHLRTPMNPSALLIQASPCSHCLVRVKSAGYRDSCKDRYSEGYNEGTYTYTPPELAKSGL